VGKATVLIDVPVQILLDLAKEMTSGLQLLAEAQKLFTLADGHPLAPFLHPRIKSCSGLPVILL
jgi:hypothetical protein